MGHVGGSGLFWVILKVSGLFWWFQAYFGNYKGFKIFFFFGHFCVFWGILVILEVSRLFWLFWCFQGILEISGSFWWFYGYFGNFEVDGLVYSIFFENWFMEKISVNQFHDWMKQNFTVKVSYFPLTKFSNVAKHLKMNYFLEIILWWNKHTVFIFWRCFKLIYIFFQSFILTIEFFNMFLFWFLLLSH